MPTAKPVYRVLRVKDVTTHTICLPDTPEGIDMLNEIRLMMMHRGYTAEADRMETIILAFYMRHKRAQDSDTR